MTKPVVGITMGDPCGVGPEIVARAIADSETSRIARTLVIGDARRLEAGARVSGVTLRVNQVTSIDDAIDKTGVANCVDIPVVSPDLAWGALSAQAGHAAYLFVERAARLALDGQVAAICTAPLNKAALHCAGHHYPGHTELLAALTGVPEVSMMLTTPTMRVIHVTTHLGLIDAIDAINPGLVLRTIQRGNTLLRRSGIDRPRIAVCAINPHAGENGLFGHGEEATKIEPGIEQAQAQGIDVVGPLPADAAFFQATQFDLVVAMYHDQGHIPVKVQGIDDGVNVTVGLPVVRTSVDHGTAFDIAGQGLASHASLMAALRQAAQLSARS